MRRRSLRIAFVIGLTNLVLLGSSGAQATTAMQLFNACDSKETGKVLWCVGVMHGAIEGIALGTLFSSGKAIVCPPTGTTPQQLQMVFLKWAKDHPSQLEITDIIMLADAFTDAFPCSTK